MDWMPSPAAAERGRLPLAKRLGRYPANGLAQGWPNLAVEGFDIATAKDADLYLAVAPPPGSGALRGDLESARATKSTVFPGPALVQDAVAGR